MIENKPNFCMQEDLGCKPTQEDISRIIAYDMGIKVLGNTVFCDTKGCSLAFSVLDGAKAVYGDCEVTETKYKTERSARTIPL